MPRRRRVTKPMNVDAALMERIEQLEKQVGLLIAAGPMTIHRDDSYRHVDPVQGELFVHAPALTDAEWVDEAAGIHRKTSQLKVYHDNRHRAYGDFVVKLFEDDMEVEDKELSWWISQDLDLTQLQRVEAGVTDTGAALTVDILKNDTSVLVDPCVIDAGDFHSTESANPVAISNTLNEFELRDKVTIQVSGGAGCMGLAVNLGFA